MGPKLDSAGDCQEGCGDNWPGIQVQGQARLRSGTMSRGIP